MNSNESKRVTCLKRIEPFQKFKFDEGQLFIFNTYSVFWFLYRFGPNDFLIRTETGNTTRFKHNARVYLV